MSRTSANGTLKNSLAAGLASGRGSDSERSRHKPHCAVPDLRTFLHGRATPIVCAIPLARATAYERSRPSSGRSATPADIDRNGRPISFGMGGDINRNARPTPSEYASETLRTQGDSLKSQMAGDRFYRIEVSMVVTMVIAERRPGRALGREPTFKTVRFVRHRIR